MSTHRAARQRRGPLASLRLRIAFGIVVVLSLVSTGTYAYWTDSATVSGTTITSGTIDLKVNDLDIISLYSQLNLSSMVPGNSVAAVLTVRNSGTAGLTYVASSSATDGAVKGLGASLTVKVTGDSSVTGSSPSATCAGTALPGSGTGLGGSLLGTGRALAPGASEPICVQVTLPANAASSLQGASTDLSLTFTASQLP